jgi:hypothetical protein
MTALAQDPRFKFAEGDPAAPRSCSSSRTASPGSARRCRARSPRWSRANLEVRRLPLAEEPGAPTAYGGSGSKDGTIPGKMWINLRTTELHRKYTLPTLVHHETIPGHVWEGEHSNQLPLIRSILAFNAFSKAGRSTAEQLADELGAYDDNPAWRLGYLRIRRSAPAGWWSTPDSTPSAGPGSRASTSSSERNGDNPEEGRGEIDRYCSWPGRPAATRSGHSEIVRQRSRAQQALGAATTCARSTTRWSTGGNVPLDVLARTSTATSPRRAAKAPQRARRSPFTSTGERALSRPCLRRSFPPLAEQPVEVGPLDPCCAATRRCRRQPSAQPRGRAARCSPNRVLRPPASLARVLRKGYPFAAGHTSPVGRLHLDLEHARADAHDIGARWRTTVSRRRRRLRPSPCRIASSAVEFQDHEPLVGLAPEAGVGRGSL